MEIWKGDLGVNFSQINNPIFSFLTLREVKCACVCVCVCGGEGGTRGTRGKGRFPQALHEFFDSSQATNKHTGGCLREINMWVLHPHLHC